MLRTPSSFQKGKRGLTSLVPWGRVQSSLQKPFRPLERGESHGGGAPQDRGLPVAGVPMAASVGLRGLFSDLPGKFCRQCLEASAQLEKNHVVPTSWQDEALARHGVSRAKTRGFHTQLDEGPETP